MSDKKGTIIYIIAITLLFVATTCIAVFVYPWKKTHYYYDNVDYEWNDEKDRYDIYVGELGYFYMYVQETTYVFAPEDATLNMAVIEKEETILNQFTRYDLVKFYINVGWRGEEL